MKHKGYASTHLGKKKNSYDDAYLVDDTLGLFLIADGSTHQFGAWASNTACRIIHESMNHHKNELLEYSKTPTRAQRTKIAAVLVQAIEQASKNIFDQVKADPQKKGVSCTVVVVQLLKDCAILAHVGNSRAYLLRDDKATLLTKDHTLYEEMAEAGVWNTENINPIFKNTLTRALGIHEYVPVCPRAIPLAPGDLILLCTNGLTDPLSHPSEDLITLTQNIPSAEIPGVLVQNAVQKGGQDNVTVLTVRMETSDAPSAAKSGQVSEKQKIESLKNIPLFQGISQSPNDLIKISSLLIYQEVAKGTELIREGEASEEMFILLKGQVNVLKDGQVIASIDEGGVIGEIGFFSKIKRTASVIATVPSQLLSLNRKDFYSLLKSDKDLVIQITFGVIQDLSNKVKHGSENLADLKTAVHLGK